jgi:homoaconitase
MSAGIHLTGQLSGWATPKDLILHLAGKLTVRVCLLHHPPGMPVNQFVGRHGAHSRILWPGGCSSIMYRYVKHSAITRIRIWSIVGLATVANMGAEVGATTSTFPYTKNMRAYLYATGRGSVARAADEAAKKGFLSADEGAEYDEVIEIVRAIMDVAPQLNFLRSELVGFRAHDQWPVHT